MYFKLWLLKSKHFASLILMLSCLIWLKTADAQVFKILATDSAATLNTVVDYPTIHKDQKYPVIVLVGGTFSERDGITEAAIMDTNKVKDYMAFRLLAVALADTGFIVVRYDPRGINGSRANCINGRLLSAKEYYNKCVDSKVRTTVTPQNFRADFIKVYEYAMQLNHVEKQRVYLMGHSEASIHMAKAIEEKKITPAGLIILAGIAESPAAHVRWQFVDRIVDLFPTIDEDGNGLVTNEEIEFAFQNKNSLLSKLITGTAVGYYSPVGSWKLKYLEPARSYLYKTFYRSIVNALSVGDPEKTPLFANDGGQQFVISSNALMLARANDDTPVIRRLAQYQKPTLWIFLSKDTQVDVSRQFLAISKEYETTPSHIKLLKLNGFGHALGSQGSGGKIEPKAIEQVVSAVVQLTKSATK
jgi:pimeloyl-ACP methyl ester carboxylesterase